MPLGGDSEKKRNYTVETSLGSEQFKLHMGSCLCCRPTLEQVGIHDKETLGQDTVVAQMLRGQEEAGGQLLLSIVQMEHQRPDL